MERASLLPLLLIAAPAFPQSILLSGFESNGVFDLTGVNTYCSLAAITGSNDTPGGGSVWSAAIPGNFSTTCAPPSITQGLFFVLPGLSQGQHADVERTEPERPLCESAERHATRQRMGPGIS